MDFTNAPVYLKVKDHSVSGEEFTLLLDEQLQLLKTHPQPAAAELGRYYESDDYISHTDSKRSVFERLYHLVREKALKDKINLIASFKPAKGKLLDIGAGTGDFLVVANRFGWSVTGVEPNEKAREIASAKGVEFTVGTESIPDGTFDAVTMWHVLEHVPDVQQQIVELKRIIKPDGVIVIAVPNFKSYDAKHYGEFWAAYDVPRHLWHFSKTAITKLFSAAGMEVVKIRPMVFDSFYVSLLSEKYQTGKMKFINGFWTGLLSNTKARRTKEYSSHIYVIKNSQNAK